MPPSVHELEPSGPWQGLHVLARGSNRLCAIDPARPDFCLKFELHADQRLGGGLRQKARRWLAARLPAWSDNHSELRAWGLLRARLGRATDGVIGAVHAIEATRWGPALRCDCLRLAAGSPARSLYHHLFQDRCYPAVELCLAVDRFEAWLLLHRVPLFDLNAGNFVVYPSDGALQLVCIDVKSVVSGKEVVPLSRWLWPLARRKVRRRAARLRQRINSVMGAPGQLAGRGRPD